ncbi:RNA polymerase II-associated factor 1 -like protein [Halotydeus destructor]|nr:RNA polymerase II-associated factor 1 -like protein [Halotydeus destructor]
MAPPVVQAPTNISTQKSPSSSVSRQRPQERKSELLCRVKWNNTLPDIPFDPKFITYPFDSNRFVSYKPTSLEKSYKHDLVAEHDLGVNIDLINPETYATVPEGQNFLSPEDERLLDDDANTSLGGGNMSLNEKRSKQHNKVVPWLKKTEYISTEFNRYGASSEKSETKVGYNVKKLFKEDTLYKDRESQIAQINKTFEEAKIPIKEAHHSKKGVYPVAVYPVLPDFANWKYPFAQVQFDAEPTSIGDKSALTDSQANEEMSEALIRGMMDEQGEQFVAYFLPTQTTLTKRLRDQTHDKEYDADDEYEYKMAREYNWVVRNKSQQGYEEIFFLVWRDDCVYYNDLETRVRLSKRRTKLGPAASSFLVVKHRPLNEQETKTHDIRLTQLMPAPQEEEVREEMQREQTTTEPAASSKPASADEEEEDKTEKEPAEKKAEKRSSPKKRKASSGSESSSSASGSSSSSSSGSESESGGDNKKKKAKKDEAEIFGSDDSD